MAESFDQIINTEFLGEDSFVGPDVFGPIYGIRLCFYNEHKVGLHMVIHMPWLTYDKHRAHMMRDQLSLSGPRSEHVFKTALDRHLQQFPDLCPHWHPLAARIVQLAEIPF